MLTRKLVLVAAGLLAAPWAWAGDVCGTLAPCNNVPEPGTWALLAVAGVAGYLASRKGRK